jgi:hypothetical protein
MSFTNRGGVRFGDLHVNVNTQGSSGNSQMDRAHAESISKAIGDALDQKLSDWVTNQSRPGGIINSSTARRLNGGR